MKKRAFVLFAGVVMAAVITGCSSLETSQNFNGLGVTDSRSSQAVAHINARVYGVFLFDWVPLFCGSVNTVSKSAIFVNTVNVNNTLGMVAREARGLGATKLININSYYESHWLWYTLMLWSRQMQISATAAK